MEERKLWELQIEWKEMINGSPGLGLTIEAEQSSVSLRLKNSGKLQVNQLSLTDSLKISLILNKKPHGSTTQSISTLFGGKLQGKVEKWLNIKVKDNKIIKIRLGLGIIKPQTKKPQSSPVKRRPSRTREIKCPYLQSLASGKQDNKEPLQNLWKIRDFSVNPQQNNSLKISLEPSSPARDRADSQFMVPPLQEINIPLLSTLSGSQLKQVVVYLCGQAQQLHMIASDLPQMRKLLQQKIQERRDLETESESQTQQMKKVCAQKDLKLQGLLSNRKELAVQLNSDREKLRARQLDLDGLRAQRGDLLRENILLQANALKNNDSYLLEKNLAALAQESATKKRSLEQNLKRATEELAASHKEAIAQNEKLQHERDEIRNELQEVSSRLKAVQDHNRGLQQQVAESKSRLSGENLKQKVKTAQSAYEGLSKKRHQILQNFSDLSQTMVKTDQEFLQSDKKMIQERMEQNQQLVDLENTDKEVQQLINELKRSLLQASNQQITLQQICCIRADLNELMSDINEFQTVRKKVRAEALQSLEIGSKLLVAQCEKTYNQASKLESIVDSVDNKDIELDSLKDQMDEAKKRNPPYVAVLSDPVDVALGEYLNNRHEPLEVRFVREDPGKYSFGSRKVHIRLENGKVLLLKAGAQYVPVDEFLEMFYQKELEKQRMPSVSLMQTVAPMAKTKQAVSSFAQAFLKLGDSGSPAKKTSPVKKK